MADDAPPPRQKFTLKPKEFERLNKTPEDADRPPPQDVFTIQRELREREIAAGLDDLKPVPARRNQRRGDFWFLFTFGNGFFAAAAWLGRDNIIVLGSAIGGVVLVTVGLIWIMWVVMGKY